MTTSGDAQHGVDHRGANHCLVLDATGYLDTTEQQVRVFEGNAN